VKDEAGYTILVEGLVQGVGFRYFVKTSAERFNIKGFVKNMNSGDVYIEAEGTEQTMQEFLRLVKRGPRVAHVRKMTVEKMETLKNFKKFEVAF
jgi:acylphosphatase